MDDCPILCAGVNREDYLKSLDALPPCFDRTGVFRVHCQRQSPGWYGALVCNQQICRDALHYFDTHPPTPSKGRQVYISLESQARPTLRFSRAALQEVIEGFRASSDALVHISVLPIPLYGWPRRHHSYSGVYAQQTSLCQFSTAMLCSREFAQTISELDIDTVKTPFDIFLATSGYSRLVMYPAAFQRSNGPSYASKTPFLDVARSFIGNPYVFATGEYLCHYSGAFFSLLFLVAALVASFIFYRVQSRR